MNRVTEERLHMRSVTIACLALSLATGAHGALAGEVKLSKGPAVARVAGKTTISFTVSKTTDVEVAIIDAKGKVVRHLAAGVLGGKTAPPPPLKPGLSQTIIWDGKDDYGKVVHPRPLATAKPTGRVGFTVRVRAGMGVKLDRIVCGDPYAFYSRDMGQGDHAAWRIAGLEAKSDGSVYVLGNANIYGPPALRAYDADGNFLRTVFPPPTGKPVEKMKGWGLNVHGDGSWAPQFQTTDSPAITRTILMGDGRAGGVPGIHPTRHPDKLLIRQNLRAMEIGTDGSCTSSSLKPLAAATRPKGSKAWRFNQWLNGAYYSCPSPDGRGFYLSGVFAGEWKGNRLYRADKDGLWRDGQVWFVDRKTGAARVFYAIRAEDVLTDLAARGASPIGGSKYTPCGAFHGVTADREGRVFICDRLHKQVVVLDKDAKVLRTIPVDKPDAIAVHPTGKALYVTTRRGTYHKRGELVLLRFNDWSSDNKPSQTIKLCPAGMYRHQSFLSVAVKGGKVSVWVAYTQLPVRVYRETGTGLELLKDFYEAGSRQRCLDMQRIAVDSRDESVYVADGFVRLFRLGDWKGARFERCYQKAGVPVQASSIAIDARRGHLYGRHPARGSGWAGPVRRYSIDGLFLPPAGVGEAGDNNLTGDVICPNWMITWGHGDRGVALAPDGNLAALDGMWGKHPHNTGVLRWFRQSEKKVPWPESELGVRGGLGGIRFDSRGNLYLGVNGGLKNIPAPFDKDKVYCRGTGTIVKYAPTGSMASGNLYPKPLAKPVKTYGVHYGPFGFRFKRTPRFGVDGWGRIYYPNGLGHKVGVIDNEGNEILRFGTYGNRDSMGGLEGDLVPTKGIPLACPNSVDATDDYIYVGDIVNIRLLRLAKQFTAVEAVEIK